MKTSEWLRKTHTKPSRELRGFKFQTQAQCLSLKGSKTAVQQDSKVQTRRRCTTKPASAFWAWHLQYEQEQA